MASTTSPDPLLGKQLGNYRIERLLGQGGMASIYFGWDVRLQRPAAVKVIDRRFRYDAAYRDRFLREARAVAAWNHPNILRVYTAGEDNGIPYFAMEFIRGMDLGRLLRVYARAGERMPHPDVLVIGRAVSSALDYAHQKGAIHRDVKPSNVLIAEDDRVVLSDFGLVMIISQGTMGKVFGSPQYISPEQARNSAAAVPRSDQYSLGVMLYEMLVGSLPFDDPSPASLALKHITQAPPSPHNLNPGLSPAVDGVLLKALSKAPEARYGSCLEMLDALERALKSDVAPGPLVPVTLTELPSSPGALTPQTMTQISLAAGDFAALSERQHPAGVPPAQAAQRQPRRPSSVQKWAGLGAGCAALLALAVLAVLFGTLYSLSRQAALRAGAHPAETRTISPLPGIAQTPVAKPGMAVTAPSETPTGQLAATPISAYELVFMAEKDASLFVIFRGPGEFPVYPLELKGDQGQIWGDEWGVEYLLPGECVTAWKDNEHAQPPKGAQCTEVGEHLTREGPERFWKGNFSVYYDGEFFGECRAEIDFCVVSINP